MIEEENSFGGQMSFNKRARNERDWIHGLSINDFL